MTAATAHTLASIYKPTRPGDTPTKVRRSPNRTAAPGTRAEAARETRAEAARVAAIIRDKVRAERAEAATSAAYYRAKAASLRAAPHLSLSPVEALRVANHYDALADDYADAALGC